MNKTKFQGHVLVLIVNVIFALNMIISKSLLPAKISPEGLTLARMMFACVAFWITSLFTKKEKVELKELGMLFLCGMFGIAINQAIFIQGLNMTSSIDSSILITSTPMFVMVFALFWLKEPITFKKASGVMLGAAGAIILVLMGDHAHTGDSSFKGNLLVILSCLSYAIYLVLAKPLTLKYSAVTIMKWMFLFSVIVLFPVDYKHLIHSPMFQEPHPAESLLRLFYVLFCATYLTYLLIPMALKRIRPTTVSMYNYVQPIVATIVAIWIGQGTLTWEKAGGALLIFLGVYLVTVSKSRADIEQEKLSE